MFITYLGLAFSFIFYFVSSIIKFSGLESKRVEGEMKEGKKEEEEREVKGEGKGREGKEK